VASLEAGETGEALKMIMEFLTLHDHRGLHPPMASSLISVLTVTTPGPTRARHRSPTVNTVGSSKPWAGFRTRVTPAGPVSPGGVADRRGMCSPGRCHVVRRDHRLAVRPRRTGPGPARVHPWRASRVRDRPPTWSRPYPRPKRNPLTCNDGPDRNGSSRDLINAVTSSYTNTQ
jgi:hypothetical protein